MLLTRLQEKRAAVTRMLKPSRIALAQLAHDFSKTREMPDHAKHLQRLPEALRNLHQPYDSHDILQPRRRMCPTNGRLMTPGKWSRQKSLPAEEQTGRSWQFSLSGCEEPAELQHVARACGDSSLTSEFKKPSTICLKIRGTSGP